jgi:hypothetical protein
LAPVSRSAREPNDLAIALERRENQSLLRDLSNSSPAVRHTAEGEGNGPARRPLKEQLMTQYLVAIHHPDDYDASAEDETMSYDIDALNEEMITAGVRIFVGGMQSARHEITV